MRKKVIERKKRNIHFWTTAFFLIIIGLGIAVTGIIISLGYSKKINEDLKGIKVELFGGEIKTTKKIRLGIDVWLGKVEIANDKIYLPTSSGEKYVLERDGSDDTVTIYGFLNKKYNKNIIVVSNKYLYSIDDGRVLFKNDGKVEVNKEKLEIKIINDKYRFNSSCTDCKLPTWEFREYDKKSGEFVLSNSFHKKEFTELYGYYKKWSEDGCNVNGVIMPLVKIYELAGGGVRCLDKMDGKMNFDFITVGDFLKIMSNIERVIKGENISIAL